MLDRQDLSRVHGKAAQPHAQQQTGQADIARHFAAHTDILTLSPALGDGLGHQAQHGRMQWVVQVRDRLVGPVNRQRVLDQVIGADRQEVEMFKKQLHI